MNDPAVQTVRMRRCAAGALLLLIGTTWRLWLAQGAFPRIPWFESLCGLPPLLDRCLLGGVAFAAASAAFGPSAPRWTRTSLGAATIFLSALLLLDQHRLQPWAWHLGVLIAVLSLAPGVQGLRCIRAWTISIYLWSAWSKADPEFLVEHGQMLLDGLLHALGASSALWSAAQRRLAAGAMPAGELLVGLLLIHPRSRRCGLAVSIGMHLTLLLALGPRGLQHEPAVLVWNACFIPLNLLLFGWPTSARGVARDMTAAPATSAVRLVERAAALLTTLVIAAPALNSCGWFDHWPSWSVYSSRPEIVEFWIDDRSVERLPPSLRTWAEPPAPLTDWRRLRLEAWSFEECSAPLYPQARWKLAVARAIAVRARLPENGLRIERLIRESWWTTTRRRETLDGAELEQTLTRFQANTQPRPEFH